VKRPTDFALATPARTAFRLRLKSALQGQWRPGRPFEFVLATWPFSGDTLAAEADARGGRVKLSHSALDRRTNYRGVVANHLVRQVTGFRAFDKDAYRREDDLFDAAMYAVLVSLGNGTEMRWSRLKRD
jgi:hypothetical protein